MMGDGQRLNNAANAGNGTTDMAIWMALGLAVVLGNVMRVSSPSGKTPFLSANDRSRWSTVRSVVEYGTFAVDDVVLLPSGARNREWYSIDMVRHVGADGKEHYYSSKPPLFTAMVAGLYAVVRTVTGASLAEQPFYVVRVLLVMVNVVPLLALWCLVWLMAGQRAYSVWTRHYVLAVAVLGTLLTPFAVTLNNHLPAAVSAGFTGWGVWRMVAHGRRQWHDMALVGFFAGLTAINELPALLLVVAAGLACVAYRPVTACWAFGAPVLLWFGAFEVANYVAHGSWRPPYMHRQDGPVVSQFAHPPLTDHARQPLPSTLRDRLNKSSGITISEQATIEPRHEPRHWTIFDPTGGVRLAVEWSADEQTVTVRTWDNWYDYEGTYWREDRKVGVDRGEPNAWVYAFHVLVGHHGILSLTPVWFLALYGWWHCVRCGERPWRYAAWWIAGITVLCVAFYLARPPYDRNYGGRSCGMRWTLWLIPFWLFCLVPGVEAWARSGWGRWTALLLLGMSVFSVAYVAQNPWQHPWIFDYWQSLGWIKY